MANIICAVIFGLGLFFIAVNTVRFYKGWIKKEKCPSVIPLLGGILCAAAILLVVNKKYYFLAIIPMLLDCGCIPAIIRLVTVFILRWNKYMTKKEKKRVKIIILKRFVIAVVVLIFAVCIIGLLGSLKIKSWHIFTNSRIEKLEEIYNADFPEDMKFSYYSAVWRYYVFDTISINHTLYIKDVDDPEKFCRETFNAPIKIMLMADIKNAVVIENNSYTEYGAECELNKYSAHKEDWRTGQRSVDFWCREFCSEPSNGHDFVVYEIFFSQNDSGDYDVKIFMEDWG